MRLNRGKTVDNLSPKDTKGQPIHNFFGFQVMRHSKHQRRHMPQVSLALSRHRRLPVRLPKAKTAKVKKEIRSAKKLSTAAERVQQHLANAKKREVETVERIQQAHRGKQGSNQDPGSEKCSQEQQQRCTSQEHPEALDSVEAHYSHPINN